MPGICTKPGKILDLLQNWKINFKLVNSVFKIHFSKCYLQINFIYIFVISTLSTQTLSFKTNLKGISLFLPGNNLENTWNFVSPEKWEPCSIKRICIHVPPGYIYNSNPFKMWYGRGQISPPPIEMK